MPKWQIKVPALVAFLLCFLAADAGTAGSFRGKVVESEQSAANPNWIFVQGRNQMVRRVEISHARIEYGQDVPAESRRAKPLQSLTPGTEVRITAEQENDGEWHATRVEIMSIGGEGKPAAREPVGKS